VQPWLLGIALFHVTLWILALSLRKNNDAQMALLASTCAIVYSTQYFNSYATDHWQALGFTQNYFESSGLFLSVVVSAPLLLLAAFQLFSSLRGAIDLLVKVKSKELRDKRVQAAKAAASASGSTEQVGAPASRAEPQDSKKNK
jgi:transmembrane protein 18